MKRFVFAFWLALISICPIAICPIAGQERAPLSTVVPILEAYIDEAMAAESIPGSVVIIVKDGKIVYLKGFGVKVAGQKEPVDEHTPFALASVTKNFTNTLVARLVDQGKINWNDKVIKYLPNFQLSDPRVTQEMTIEDLLSHRSGLPDFTADTLITLGWRAPEIYETLRNFPLQSEFRKSFDYQNALVGLVGAILEKVAGKPLTQLYQEELFQPIGLEETQLGETPPQTFWQKILTFFKKSKPVATFHDLLDGKARPLPNGNPYIYTLPASSGIVSTGHDMAKWMIFQLNEGKVGEKRIVSEANLNEMRKPHIFNERQSNSQFPKNRISRVEYGMGWFIHDYMGVPMLNHMGGMNGTRALLLIIPGDNLGIAVMANLGGMRASLFPEAIRSKFLDLYLNAKEDIDWAKLLREQGRTIRDKYHNERRLQMRIDLRPARNLNDYAGVYENSLYGRIGIIKKDNALLLVYRDHPPMKLTHWNGNIFEFSGSDLSLGFGATDHGEIAFSDEPSKADRLMINLLHEGVDPVFQRVRE
jgi:CubicO group peptidase (beta-lactamase class C family)